MLSNWDILRAFNPFYGVSFLASHGMIGLTTLGVVFLVVTGTDVYVIRHFGRGPILAWLTVALPALLLNYLGQGALVLADPKVIETLSFCYFPDGVSCRWFCWRPLRQ